MTARSAASAGARVLKTLRSWGLEVDEALFLAGAPKGPLLQKIRPHIFFDDQMFHIEGAQELGTISAHVPYGIGQKYHKGKRIDTSEAEKKWKDFMIIKYNRQSPNSLGTSTSIQCLTFDLYNS